MKDMTKNILLWVVIAFALLSMFNYFGPRNKPDTAMTYTNFIAAINQGTIRQLSIDGEIISGCLLYTSPSPRDTERSRMPSSA